jgi:hypothetical protein
MFDSSRWSSRVRFKEGASLKEVENKAKVSRPRKTPKFISNCSLCVSVDETRGWGIFCWEECNRVGGRVYGDQSVDRGRNHECAKRALRKGVWL